MGGEVSNLGDAGKGPDECPPPKGQSPHHPQVFDNGHVFFRRLLPTTGHQYGYQFPNTLPLAQVEAALLPLQLHWEALCLLHGATVSVVPHRVHKLLIRQVAIVVCGEGVQRYGARDKAKTRKGARGA
jgi:hypothetical protein